MTFWPGECRAFRARPRVCVWGDGWAYRLARIREWERDKVGNRRLFDKKFLYLIFSERILQP